MRLKFFKRSAEKIVSRIDPDREAIRDPRVNSPLLAAKKKHFPKIPRCLRRGASLESCRKTCSFAGWTIKGWLNRGCESSELLDYILQITAFHGIPEYFIVMFAGSRILQENFKTLVSFI